MMRMLQTLRRRANGEGGFTIVEAMISISILAVGAFAVAQAMMFGLSTIAKSSANGNDGSMKICGSMRELKVPSTKAPPLP